MPVIKSVSDLRNYNFVLEDVSIGSHVYLSMNGHVRYVVMDIKEYGELQEKTKKYDKMVVELEILHMLNEGEDSAAAEGWISETDIVNHFENRFSDE